jgi:hypothetical protein
MRMSMIVAVAALVQVCGSAVATPPSNQSDTKSKSGNQSVTVTGSVPATTTQTKTGVTGTVVTPAGQKLIKQAAQKKGQQTAQNGNTIKVVGSKVTNGFGNDPFPAFSQAQRPARTHIDLTMAYMGEWNTTTNAWNEGNTTATTTQGKARFFPTMGGRFVCADTEGELFGKPFKSMGFIGFNATENRYEASWVNTTDTGIAAFNGERNTDGTFAWTGNTTSPATGKVTQSRATTTFNGKDTFTYTFFTTGVNGQEFKVYETTYNRVSLGGPFAIRPVGNGQTAQGFGQTGRQQGSTPQRTTGVTEQSGQINGN